MRPVSQQTTPLIQRGDVVVFQGDSITDAFRKPEEIIDAYQLGAGYVLLIASGLMRNRPDEALGFFNRGISGNTICDLIKRWQQDTIALKPDVVSLLIGVNDVGQQVAGNTACSPQQFEDDYRSLLLRTRAALPDVRLVLCEPFALLCGRVREDWLTPLTERQRIVATLAQEFDSLFVPLQSEFDAVAKKKSPEYWIHDGIHPTAAGHRLIADSWLRATRRQTIPRTTFRESIPGRGLTRPMRSQRINSPRE